MKTPNEVARLEDMVRDCLLSAKYRKQKVLCEGRVHYCTLLLDMKEVDFCPCAGGYINIPKGEYMVDVPYLKCNPTKRPHQVSWMER